MAKNWRDNSCNTRSPDPATRQNGKDVGDRQRTPRWAEDDQIFSSKTNGNRQNNARSADRRQMKNYFKSTDLISTAVDPWTRHTFDKRHFFFRGLSKNVRRQMQVDEVAHYSVTDTRTADEISKFIAQLDGLRDKNTVITDGTACVGGNTMSFCRYFKKVQAIELDETRYHMLKHNLNILGYRNADCYCGDYLDYIGRLTQDVVFLHPPWGGPSYKDKKYIDLFLGNVSLGDICEMLKSKAKYVIVQAPLNFNYKKFQETFGLNSRTSYSFRKMLLIIVDLQQPKISKISIPRSPAYQPIENLEALATEAAKAAAAYFDDYRNDDDRPVEEARNYAYKSAYDTAHTIAVHAASHEHKESIVVARQAAIAAYNDAYMSYQDALVNSNLHAAGTEAHNYYHIMDAPTFKPGTHLNPYHNEEENQQFNTNTNGYRAFSASTFDTTTRGEIVGSTGTPVITSCDQVFPTASGSTISSQNVNGVKTDAAVVKD